MKMSGKMLTLAIAVTAAMLAAPALAQQKMVGQVVGGAAINATAGSDVTVSTGSKNTVVNWQQFQMGNKNLTFTNVGAAGNNNILNKVAAGQLAIVNGKISTDKAANVFLFAPGGILFGKGAVIDTGIGGSFFAAAKEWQGTDANFVNDIPKNSVGAFPSLGLWDAKLEIQDSVHGGKNSNLWLIGTEKSAWVERWTVGAHWMDGPEVEAYKNVATLKVTPAAPGVMGWLDVQSGPEGKMWLGKIDAPNTGVYLSGMQIWVQSVKAGNFVAMGGTDTKTIWNPGVWVYGEIPNPLEGLKGAKYTGANAIEVTGNVSINGVWNWVSGRIDAGGDVVIGRDPADLAKAGEALSVWLVDVVSKGNVSLFADAVLEADLGNTAKGTRGGVWLNSISAKALKVVAEGDFVTWLGFNVAGTNGKGITVDGKDITKDSELKAVVDATRAMMRGPETALTLGGFVNKPNQNYYW